MTLSKVVFLIRLSGKVIVTYPFLICRVLVVPWSYPPSPSYQTLLTLVFGAPPGVRVTRLVLCDFGDELTLSSMPRDDLFGVGFEDDAAPGLVVDLGVRDVENGKGRA